MILIKDQYNKNRINNFLIKINKIMEKNQSTSKKLAALFEKGNKDSKIKKTAPTKPNFSNSTTNNKGYYNKSNQFSGLTNFGNSCFSNVVIQSILSSIDFLERLSSVFLEIETLEQKIIDSEFPAIYNLFQSMSFYLEKNSYGAAKHLQILSLLFDPFGKQNDAHEFLVYVLNKAHEECLNFNSNYKKNSDSNNNMLDDVNNISNKLNNVNIGALKSSKNKNIDDEDNWEEVKKGGKKMKATNNEKDFPISEISRMFGGLLKHETIKTGCGISNSKVEPFYAITVNPENFYIEKCLDAYFGKRYIDGAKDTYSKAYLDRLSEVIVFQVKSFYYDKVNKMILKDTRPISYEHILKIKEDWLSPFQSNLKNTEYELCAIIVHQGKQTTEGHYVCFCKENNTNKNKEKDNTEISGCNKNDKTNTNNNTVKDSSKKNYNNFGKNTSEHQHQNINTIEDKWFYINDSKLVVVNKNDVLNMRPYLMFYKKINK